MTMVKQASKDLKEALFYRRLESQRVECELCPRRCNIAEGKRGFCRARENRAGTLYSLVYGRPCSVELGPIEKAPIYHFLPSHFRLCLSTVGCNLRCRHCQNWSISQASAGETMEHNLSPQEIVELAKRQRANSISYTFTEPTIFYEYMYDISKLAKEEGLKTSIISNGYINAVPLKKLLGVLDAVKIDLKGFSDEFYKRVCSAELAPVLDTLKLLKEERAYFEIVNLVIPTLNDSPDQIKRMCLWIKENLGKDVPLHFTRFSPAHKMVDIPPTPTKTLEAAYRIAKDAGLNYVYIGNVPGHKYNSTFCPRCGKELIHRVHFEVLTNHARDGRCTFCGYEIIGVWR